VVKGFTCVLMLVAVAVYAPCVAADDLDDLKALFREDPAEGFQVADEMFDDAWEDGDLDWMLEIIRLTAHWGYCHCYFAVAEDMFDAAIPLAQDSGQWEILGELYTPRGSLLRHSWRGGS